MPSHVVQPPDWIDGAPILVSKSVDIAASPADIWAQVVDHRSWPQWFVALDRVELLGAPTGVGGGRRVHAGRTAFDECFTAWDDAEYFAFAVTSSPLPMLETLAESVRLIPIDAGTQVMYRQGVSGRCGLGWAMRAVWRRAPGQLEESLANLRSRVEAVAV